MIQSGSIRLRPISEDDTDLILELRNDLKNAANFFSDPPLYDFGHKKWLASLDLNGIYMVIEYVGEKVGTITITNIDYRHQKAEYGRIVVKDSYRGKGIAFTASNLLISYVFHNLPIRKINLEVFADNIQAVRFYEKLGFEKEGLFKKEYYKNGTWKDVLRMALFRETWEEKYANSNKN